MRATLAATFLPTAATLRLRQLGITIPVAVALMLAGVALIGQAVWRDARAVLAQVMLERAFAQTIASGKGVQPWSEAQAQVAARIELPRLGRSAIMLADTGGQALAFGSGQAERTPQAGGPGTAIYAAHRDARLDFLGDLVVGDEIVVTRGDGRSFRFHVTGHAVVRWDASGVDPYAAGRHLVLVSCWPLDGRFSGPLRYLVHAELVVEVRDVRVMHAP